MHSARRAVLDRAIGETWRDDSPWELLPRLTELYPFVGLDTPPRDLPRLDPADLADTFVDPGYQAGMRAADIWPAEWEA